MTAVASLANGFHLPILSSSDLSLIIGWTSCWIWLVPSVSQLYENYVLKSGEGLSITFIMIWLAGDALNMIGAMREGLLPTMIILAGYYCICDLALIWQYYYYRKYHDFYHPPAQDVAASETTPLVQSSSSSSSPPKSMAPSTLRQELFRCAVGLCLVSVAGVMTWFLTTRVGWRRHPTSPDNMLSFVPLTMLKHHGGGGSSHDRAPIEWKWDAQISGWASAFLYLASRIPQIFKNQQTKCEGLSLALFVFSVAGNLTYCASILIKSTERDYIIENLSWLVGSLGTVFLDFIVLGQFVHYRDERNKAEREQQQQQQRLSV